MINEFALIQSEMKNITGRQNSLVWYQRKISQQASNQLFEYNSMESEPLSEYSKAFTSTLRQPNFANFNKEFTPFHQSITQV